MSLDVSVTIALCVLAAFAGGKWGAWRGARRERARIVTFFQRAAWAVRRGEPGPAADRLTNPADLARLAEMIELEDDRVWIRARFRSRAERAKERAERERAA